MGNNSEISGSIVCHFEYTSSFIGKLFYKEWAELVTWGDLSGQTIP